MSMRDARARDIAASASTGGLGRTRSGRRRERGGGDGPSRGERCLVVTRGAVDCAPARSDAARSDAARESARGDGKLRAVVEYDEDGREGGDRVRWRVARPTAAEAERRSPEFQAFVCDGKRTKIGWRFVMRAGDDGVADSVSVYVQRSRDAARAHAVEAALSVTFIGAANDERHFETFFDRRFDREGDMWGIKHVFNLADDLHALGNLDDEFVVEVWMSELRVSRHRSKPPPQVASSVRVLSNDCLLFVLEDFLSEEEGDQLIEIARPSMQRSRVTDGKLSEGRTSTSTFLTGARAHDDLVLEIERRIQAAIRLPLIVERRKNVKVMYQHEPMQIVQYGPTERYTAHYDNRAGSLKRSMTFMCYLQEPEEGGATFFPKCVPLCGCDSTTLGIRVFPKRGRAILFWNVGENGQEAMRSLHEAQPVVSGKKAIFTQWLSISEDT